MHQAVHFRDGVAANQADLAALAHAAGDHAGQVGGFLDVVVEHREVGLLRLARRPHQEGGLRVVLGHLAGGGFHREGLAHHQLVALLGVLAHDALVVGVGDVFRERVVDLATVARSRQRLVDARHPLLFDRHRIDGGNLGLGGCLGLGLRRARQQQRAGRGGRGQLQQPTASDAACGQGGQGFHAGDSFAGDGNVMGWQRCGGRIGIAAHPGEASCMPCGIPRDKSGKPDGRAGL
ncbi:hypothetical protein D3C73_1148740 [compost metagenome]